MDQDNNDDKRRVVKKPGITSERAKALDDLVRAKTTGIRRSVQYEVFLFWYFNEFYFFFSSGGTKIGR